MDVIFQLLGFALVFAGGVCSIIILIAAFQDEIWKGFVALLCGLYALYYALFEFDHDQKWLIVLGAVGGGGIGAVLLRMGGIEF